MQNVQCKMQNENMRDGTMNESGTGSTGQRFDPFAITRPAPVLLAYYALVSLVTGPAFPLVLLPLFCKYVTLRYRFDEKGISMSYGVLFRRETLLTYRRIQDIHLTHNIVQRWLGLATVSIQTASGAAGAEMAIEGILEAEALRDFLYQRMRGARGLDWEEAGLHEQRGTVRFYSADSVKGDSPRGFVEGDSPRADGDEATALLRDIRDALVTLAKRGEAGP
jgi:putative membrane protein